jgi:outer membrane protein assembly factor BamB
MRFTHVRTFGLVLALLILTSPAFAVIKVLLPLRQPIEQEQFIFVAKVEALDPDKPSVVLVPEEDLKGKAPFKKLPVLLKGDSEADKDKQTPQLLKRLAPDLRVVLFVSLRETRYTCFAFTNGTWFQLRGEKDGEAVRWGFLHLEPYLRRTYKGTTDELKGVVADVLAGKAKPPAPDADAEPGLGPEANPAKKPKEKGAALPPGNVGGPVFAVIPTVLIGGPLAVLAMLFPTLFGGVMLFFRRWMVAFSVLATTSTLFFLYDFFRADIKDFWWGKPAALWVAMTVLAAVGALWSWRRSLATAATAPTAPTRAEHILLIVMSLSGLAVVAFLVWGGVPLLNDTFKFVLCLWAGVWVAHVYALLTASSRTVRPTVPAEGVLLTVTVIVTAALGLGTMAPAASAAVRSDSPEEATTGVAKLVVSEPELAWQPFSPRDRAWFDSSPVIDGDRIYIGAAMPSGFSSSGKLFCIDRNTGKEVWSFDDGINVKQMYCTPTVANGKVYFGEGYHQDQSCKLYCLKADTGEKVWEFATTSHTESSPAVVGGRVYFGAGDDGVYCLDSETGEKKWQYPKVHVDSSPAVVGGRVYAGSGIGDRYTETVVLCLDAESGKEVWKTPVDLPAWGSTAVSNGQVFVGLGNGNFFESDRQKPSGAVLCLEARTGQRLWRFDAGDSVLDRPALGRQHVWFGSRDGHCYCVDRDDGKLAWKYNLGSPSVTAVAAAPSGVGGGVTSVYALGSTGKLACLRPDSDKPYYVLDISGGQPMELFSSPCVTVSRKGGVDRRRICFGATLQRQTTAEGRLYCFEDRLSEEE